MHDARYRLGAHLHPQETWHVSFGHWKDACPPAFKINTCAVKVPSSCKLRGKEQPLPSHGRPALK